MDLGVKFITRETFLSSLSMATDVLEATGLSPAEARDTAARFRAHDEAVLQRQYAVHTDEAKLIQTSREAAAELDSLFESDAERGGTAAEPSAVELARSWK
jgi:voltage-gated potassium channel Kch